MLRGALSNRRLGLIFFIALTCFTLLRLQPTQYIIQHAEQISDRLGFTVEIADASIGLFSLQFDQVKVSHPQSSRIWLFERVDVSPFWSAWLQGDAGAGLNIHWQNSSLSADLVYSDAEIDVQDILAEVDAADLNALMPSGALAKLSGNALLEGSVVMNSGTGLPESGELRVDWQPAALNIIGSEIALGHLTALLNGSESHWKWLCHDVESKGIQAEGALKVRGADVRSWPVSGVATLNVKQLPASALQTWLPADAESLRYNISGFLGSPVVNPLQ